MDTQTGCTRLFRDVMSRDWEEKWSGLGLYLLEWNLRGP